ncbi:MAG: hypothetical protein AAGF47_06685, partial [Planctomycetota bacterium]
FRRGRQQQTDHDETALKTFLPCASGYVRCTRILSVFFSGFRSFFFTRQQSVKNVCGPKTRE